MWCLAPLGSPDRTLRPLDAGQVLVGRSPECDLCLEDPRISRHHARLDVTAEEVRVLDLGSHNGVLVNGRRVVEATLRPGDEVRFGPLAFSLRQEGTTDQPDTPKPSQILERGRLTPVPPPDTRRLRVLYEIVHTLVANLDLADILPSVLDTLRDLFAYDRCAIAGRGADGELSTWASYPSDAATFSRTIAEQVLDQGEALLCDDVQGKPPFSLSESIVGLQIRSVLCSPLIFRGQVRGVIYLDRSVAGAYSLDDLALLHHVCDLVAIAIENARLYADLQARFQESTERLKEVQTRLVESEQIAALGQLTKAVAHEVRNPIAVIGGMSRRLSRRARDPEVAADVATIMAEAQRLEALLQNVEEVVALPDPSFRLEPLEDAVRGALETAEPLLTTAGILAEIRSRLSGRPVPHDPSLTRTALVATLRKTCAAAKSGAAVRILLGETGKGWSIRVTDAPERASEGDRKDFFDPFFRTHPWADDLALTLATTAMERQGGSLRLGTDPAQGTDIELTLSASAPEEMGSAPRQTALSEP